MNAIRKKTKVQGRTLTVSLPESFENKEVEVLIVKLKKNASARRSTSGFIKQGLIKTSAKSLVSFLEKETEPIF